MPIQSRIFVALLLLVFTTSFSRGEETENRFESSIKKFEQQDKESPPTKGGVLFIGSSSIRGWNLDKSFPNKNYLNRGFGGSEVSDSIHFAQRIIIPYAPRVMVLYAGDNDLAHDKSPETVAADFQKLVKIVHASLPNTRIVFIAIKPSIKRWSLIENVRAANSAIQQFTQKNPNLEFVDIDAPMIGKDGKPRLELFAKDGLHLSPAGYALWTSLVKPHLGK